jgi:hypothetical protein
MRHGISDVLFTGTNTVNTARSKGYFKMEEVTNIQTYSLNKFAINNMEILLKKLQTLTFALINTEKL